MGLFTSKIGESSPSSGFNRTLYTSRDSDCCGNVTTSKYRVEGGDCVKRTSRSGPSKDWEECCECTKR